MCSSDLRDRVCAVQIWCECLGNGSARNMTVADSKRINDILGTLKFDDRILRKERLHFGKKYGQQRGYAIKFL